MITSIEKFGINIKKISDTGTERSYYRFVCQFLEEFAGELKNKDVLGVSEESSTVHETNIGFPDITIKSKNRLVGWVEVKLPDNSLNSEKNTAQFIRYRESLENILFTNLREWQLWQWDSEGKPQKISEILFDPTSFALNSENDFKNLLLKFFEGRPYEARTPKQLALALAKKTKLLSNQVEESFDETDKESDLVKLKSTFERTLIQDISTHQFANMIAETLAYSLFLAFLEHIHRGNGSEITLRTAIDYLPTNVPVLKDLYGLISKVSETIPAIYKSTQTLIEQLESSDINKIYQKLIEHKPGEDPVIQFYEPFLKEYDPKEREARGVYYTPKPVVDYIVRSVDWILRNKFGKEDGLADESVQLLDPATGTGTFLMSAIQEIYQNTRKENIDLGEEVVKQKFNKIVLNHILKHFYGFELMIAPYAIAHLKLTLELERLGFDFSLTKDDKDPDNDRLKVYLANTLDNPNQPTQDFFGFSSIPKESEQARLVKKDTPILAIIGNPPYSISSQNQSEWIMSLTSDYKKNLNEQNINALSDDYVKFIRFASWKLSETGQGVFAMITSNTFVDGLVHREMRKILMETFNEIYIYNLHGNLRRSEEVPGGGKDENVFDIQSGVSINIFIKNQNTKVNSTVSYCDLFGLREHKFNVLLEENFNDTKWSKLIPTAPNYFFVKKNISNDQEYNNYVSVKDIFPINGSGIKFRKDNLLIKGNYNKQDVVSMLEDIKDLDSNSLKSKYSLTETKDWKLEDKKQYFLDWKESDIQSVQYRPFDTRWTYYPIEKISNIITRGDSRSSLMGNLLHNNVGLITTRQYSSHKHIVVFATNKLVEISSQPFAPNNIFPLYIYENTKQQSLLDNELPKPNISSSFIELFSNKLSLTFISNGKGDLEKTFGPEDILYYSYSVFHSPTYRNRYSEQLKIGFPRLPITRDRKLFKALVTLGNELMGLHLLGENPFDKSKTIFDDKSKWGITPQTVEKPDDFPDWKVSEVRYDENEKRVYVNPYQFFEGVEKNVWEFMVGGYQVCDKWLKDRKKAERQLSLDDLIQYIKVTVSLKETIRIMNEIDTAIPSWPME